MKRIFTDPNPLIVGNIHNLLEQAGIEVIYRNEFTAGGAGEIAPLDTWLEVWLVNEGDTDKALGIIGEAQSAERGSPWRCNGCGEENPPAFGSCWQCGEIPDD